MTPKFKAKWIADLRKYPKTTGYLKNETGYCCLGVACLTLGATFDMKVPGYKGDHRPILNGTNLADGEALTYTALSKIGLTNSNQNKLIDINDRSSTFEPVIAWIEEHL